MLQRYLQDTYQYLFDCAHEALKVGPSFVAFGAGVRRTGEQIRAELGDVWRTTTPQDHISGLIAGFRVEEEGNGLIAAGLVFDTASSGARLEERALCFHLETANGKAVQVLVPYLRQDDRRVLFGDPDVSEAPPEIFTNVRPG